MIHQKKCKYNLQEILEIPILKVAERLDLKPKNKKALCFNHNDTNPSLSFSPEKNLFKCFVCGIKGNVINLVMSRLGCDKATAIQYLGKNFILNIQYDIDNRKIENKHIIKKTSNKEYDFNTILWNQDVYKYVFEITYLEGEGLEYLATVKKFEKELLLKLNIKYVSDGSNFIDQMLKRFDIKRLQMAGLYKQTYSKQLWHKVILFPYYNLDNKICNITRRFVNNPKLKFLNLHSIKTIPYNFHIINTMKKGEKLFICEGITDTIAMLQKSKKAIGISGALSFKEEFVRELINFNIIVVPDNDVAGNGFYNDIKNKFQLYNKSVTRLIFDKNKKDIWDYFYA